jgi:hypothetical protein
MRGQTQQSYQSAASTICPAFHSSDPVKVLTLMLEVDRFPTARILQSLLIGYVQHFNKMHRRRGRLFEGRYKTILCERDGYLLDLYGTTKRVFFKTV